MFLHKKKTVGKNRSIWLLVITLLFYYGNVINRIPVSYWDEMIWVGRSYFVDFYLKGDFDSRVWQSIPSYDQPKLAEYMYGLWIYPRYLYEKSISKSIDLDYPRYLINHGFYLIDESYLDKYKNYYQKKLPDISTMVDYESGGRDYYLQKYGNKILPTLDLVTYARKINILWLILSVVLVYKIFEKGMGKNIAMFGAMTYATNSLVVTSALKAHAEGLFLFLFNLSIWLMLCFFKTKSWKTLLILAITIGLCTNTKLNGLMLLPIFSVTFILWTRKNINWLSIAGGSLTILLITASLLVIINPFLYDNPIGKSGVLFEKRALAASIQANLFPEAALKDPIVRLVKIGDNFFSPFKIKIFNEVYGLNLESKLLSFGLIVTFVAGILKVFMEAVKGNSHHQFILLMSCVIVVSMLGYLILDWDRYYILLVLPMVYFQLIGGLVLIQNIYTRIWAIYYKFGSY